jgi:hypothetical protein
MCVGMIIKRVEMVPGAMIIDSRSRLVSRICRFLASGEASGRVIIL